MLLIGGDAKRGCDDASPTSQLRLAHQSPAASLPVFLRPETSGITITCGRTRTASVENDQDLWGIVPTFSCRVDAEREVQFNAMEEVRRSEECFEKTREGALDDHCCWMERCSL